MIVVSACLPSNAISQRLPFYWGFSDLGHGVSPLGHSHKNTREVSTHGYHQMLNREIGLIIFFVAKDEEALYSQQKKKKKRPGADCGSDHELLIAKIRLKLKRVSRENH